MQNTLVPDHRPGIASLTRNGGTGVRRKKVRQHLNLENVQIARVRNTYRVVAVKRLHIVEVVLYGIGKICLATQVHNSTVRYLALTDCLTQTHIALTNTLHLMPNEPHL